LRLSVRQSLRTAGREREEKRAFISAEEGEEGSSSSEFKSAKEFERLKYCVFFQNNVKSVEIHSNHQRANSRNGNPVVGGGMPFPKNGRGHVKNYYRIIQRKYIQMMTRGNRLCRRKISGNHDRLLPLHTSSTGSSGNERERGRQCSWNPSLPSQFS
jgi:hypothetical protein